MKSSRKIVFGVAFLALAFYVQQQQLTEVSVYLAPLIDTSTLIKTVSETVWIVSAYLLPLATNLGLYEPLDCFENNTLRVGIVAPKGGFVFTFFTFMDLSFACGTTVTIPKVVYNDGWKKVKPFAPGDREAGFYIDFGHAMRWPEYVDQPFNKGKDLSCLVMTREPFARIMSFYKYSRDGGERGLKVYADHMKTITSPKERFEYMWDQIAMKMMERTHEALTNAMSKGCVQFQVEGFFTGGEHFDKAAYDLLDVLKVKPGVQDILLQKLRRHDLSLQPKEKRDANSHVSGKSLEPGESDFVKKLIRSEPKYAKKLYQQCKDLNYKC